MDDATRPGAQPDPTASGRLTREAALALLQRGGELLASGDYAEAGQRFSRVVGFDDPAVTAAALLGLGEAHYRLNNEPAAVQTWSAILQLPETPSTYAAWRNIAAARVRDGDLPGAMAAYREADRRAPAEDKAEIANRLGWLSKETGNTRAAGRYFAKGRGDGPRVTVTLLLIALTTIVSLTAMLSTEKEAIYGALSLDGAKLAAGEYWRLWTVTLVHSPDDPLHLIFNMYALWLAGSIVERWYGPVRFLAFYLACAAAGSTASFLSNGDVFSVGASGAIFGLFGILLAAGRVHHPVDRQSRGIMNQLVVLVILNIGLGFASGGSIDNAAHLGGLAAGLWLGALVPPTHVPTLSSLWHRPVEQGVGAGPTTAPSYVVVVGLAVVAVVVVAGVAVGTGERSASGAEMRWVARVEIADARSHTPAAATGVPARTSGAATGAWSDVLTRNQAGVAATGPATEAAAAWSGAGTRDP